MPKGRRPGDRRPSLLGEHRLWIRSVLAWLRRVHHRLWSAQQRAVDAKILWPSFREQAATLDDAREGMRWHMARDPAYAELSPAEREAFLRGLPE
jgi:hypothetical protein